METCDENVGLLNRLLAEGAGLLDLGGQFLGALPDLRRRSIPWTGHKPRKTRSGLSRRRSTHRWDRGAGSCFAPSYGRSKGDGPEAPGRMGRWVAGRMTALVWRDFLVALADRVCSRYPQARQIRLPRQDIGPGSKARRSFAGSGVDSLPATVNRVRMPAVL